MEQLDLHHMRHEAAKRETIRFIESILGKSQNAIIITGHSEMMRKIVISILDEYDLKYYVGGYLGLDMASITVEVE